MAGLERDLPGNGAAIKTAFQSIIDELVFLRASAAPATRTAELTTTTHDYKKTEPTPQPTEPKTSPSDAPLRTPPGYPGTLDDIIVRINELQSQVDAVKSRCHCEHVDYHEIQIQTLLSKT